MVENVYFATRYIVQSKKNNKSLHAFYILYLCVMLVASGTSAFDSIITSLSSTMTEFIPYVIYIALGVLGAVIGFVAIKWLMNWTRAKVLGTFSSGRRRR